jgi:hypothetical protein
MQADYTIEVPIDVTELYELLEGDEFTWIFRTNEDTDVRIRVNIQPQGVEIQNLGLKGGEE